MSRDLSLVPPGRFGALLATTRRESDLSVADLALASGGTWSALDLDSIERGTRALSDRQVSTLSALYALDTGSAVVPDRGSLIIDLDRGSIGIGEAAVSVTSNELDDVLERYLSLLYLVRNMTPGSELTLRDRDLTVLSDTLQRTLIDLERRLGQLMIGETVDRRTRLLGRRVSIPAVGLLVAVTAVGSLILVNELGPDVATAAGSTTVRTEPTTLVNTSAADRAPGTVQLLLPAAATSVAGTLVESPTVIPTSTVDPAIEAGDTTVATTDTAAAVGNLDASAPAIVTLTEPTAASPSAIPTAVPIVITTAAAPVVATAPAPAPAPAPTAIPATAPAPQPTAIPATAIPATAIPATAIPATTIPATAIPATAIPATAIPATAIPTAAPTSPVASTWDQIGASAESLIGYNWRGFLPGWTVSYEGDNPGYRGLTNTQNRTITIFINPGDSASAVAGILAHEVAHAIDVQYLTATQREQWLNARGMPLQWWPGSGLSDFAVGAGDFAEAVASYLTGSPSDSTYGAFTQEQLQLAASFLP